jgi:hypothetical protein
VGAAKHSVSTSVSLQFTHADPRSPSYLSFLHKITGGLWQEYLTSNKPLREEFASSAWYARSLWK